MHCLHVQDIKTSKPSNTCMGSIHLLSCLEFFECEEKLVKKNEFMLNFYHDFAYFVIFLTLKFMHLVEKCFFFLNLSLIGFYCQFIPVLQITFIDFFLYVCFLNHLMCTLIKPAYQLETSYIRSYGFVFCCFDNRAFQVEYSNPLAPQ